MNINWIEYENDNGTCVYVEIETDGFTYELGVLRMNDERNEKYQNRATGYKYNWYLDTTEIFGYSREATGSILADDYVMTLEEGMQAALDAFFKREEYRQNWIEALPYI